MSGLTASLFRLHLASRSAALGRYRRDPVMVLAAARIVLSVAPTPVERVCTTLAAQELRGPIRPWLPSNGLLAVDDLVFDARAFTGGGQTIRDAITEIRATRPFGGPGLVCRASTHSVGAGLAQVFALSSTGGLAEATLVTDGRAPLTLELIDASGMAVVRSGGIGPQGNVTPPLTAPAGLSIRVTNQGSRASVYVLYAA